MKTEISIRIQSGESEQACFLCRELDLDVLLIDGEDLDLCADIGLSDDDELGADLTTTITGRTFYIGEDSQVVYSTELMLVESDAHLEDAIKQLTRMGWVVSAWNKPAIAQSPLKTE